MIDVEWTLPAQADLARIDDELAATDPDYADRVGMAAIAAARFLTEWPRARSEHKRGKHKWSVKGPPYILTYRVKCGRLEITRVHHERENWR